MPSKMFITQGISILAAYDYFQTVMILSKIHINVKSLFCKEATEFIQTSTYYNNWAYTLIHIVE